MGGIWDWVVVGTRLTAVGAGVTHHIVRGTALIPIMDTVIHIIRIMVTVVTEVMEVMETIMGISDM